MSKRTNLRRKVVLPLHVIRPSTGEKQLAHTLDVTESSARLGGLNFLLEPGEVVEIQRAAARARFEVLWMGAPASPMAGQAGVRSLDPNKSIWGVNLPQDQNDMAVDASLLRTSTPSVRSSSRSPGGKRWHERCQCDGSATLKTVGTSFAIYGLVKDISESGVYIEMTAPLPVKVEITIGIKVEDVWIEAEGTVRTSYPLVGMGVHFRKLTVPNREKLAKLLEHLKKKASAENGELLQKPNLFTPSRTEPGPNSNLAHPIGLDAYPVRMLALACHALVENFEVWRNTAPPDEIADVRHAITKLHLKFAAPAKPELIDLQVRDPLAKTTIIN